MTALAIRKQLTDYIKIADDKKIKAIYTIVEDDIHTTSNNWDKEFIEELERRSKNVAKTYSWEETKAAAIQKVKTKCNIK